ncbi:hypothetical protein C8A00DRAFT_34757 [Chaetomidium leptoderma]|uniref:Uncharacterized protein n=1 Tax=Chaetomidium leptoderma TaxID=669021 RepID=A0AAN6ZXK8_9PEZI|nr:hypothetical protein C8A00DRAFT_34757 [Chaetomidium leptoderma]
MFNQSHHVTPRYVPTAERANMLVNPSGKSYGVCAGGKGSEGNIYEGKGGEESGEDERGGEGQGGTRGGNRGGQRAPRRGTRIRSSCQSCHRAKGFPCVYADPETNEWPATPRTPETPADDDGFSGFFWVAGNPAAALPPSSETVYSTTAALWSPESNMFQEPTTASLGYDTSAIAPAMVPIPSSMSMLLTPVPRTLSIPMTPVTSAIPMSMTLVPCAISTATTPVSVPDWADRLFGTQVCMSAAVSPTSPTGILGYDMPPISCNCFDHCMSILQALERITGATAQPPSFQCRVALGQHAVGRCLVMLSCDNCIQRSTTHMNLMILGIILEGVGSLYIDAARACATPAAMADDSQSRNLQLGILTQHFAGFDSVCQTYMHPFPCNQGQEGQIRGAVAGILDRQLTTLRGIYDWGGTACSAAHPPLLNLRLAPNDASDSCRANDPNCVDNTTRPSDLLQ